MTLVDKVAEKIANAESIKQIKTELKQDGYSNREISKAIKQAIDEKLVQRGEKQQLVENKDSRKTWAIGVALTILLILIISITLFYFLNPH